MESNAKTGELMPATKAPPSTAEIVALAKIEVSSFVGLVDVMVIDSAEAYEIGNAVATDIRNAEAKHEEARQKIANPLWQAFKATNELFKPLADDLATAKAALGKKMIAFSNAERDAREAEERRAAEERRQAQAEADANLAAATQALVAGAPGAEAAFEEATVAQAVADSSMTMAPIAPKLAKGGNASRVRFVATITDLPAFLEHAAKLLRGGDLTLEKSIDIKLGALNTLGTATQGSLKVPGVTFTKDEKFIARKSK